VEFSAPGSEIEVALARRGPRIQLTVSNSGPTLSEDELEKVFDAMFSNHPAEVEATPGRSRPPHLGIGLYIVRLIAESMGGRSFARNSAAQGEGEGAVEDGVETGVEVGIDVPAVEPGG